MHERPGAGISFKINKRENFYIASKQISEGQLRTHRLQNSRTENK